MAITHEQDIAIARPPAEAFAKLVDIERWPTWLIASGIVRVERRSPATSRTVRRSGSSSASRAGRRRSTRA